MRTRWYMYKPSRSIYKLQIVPYKVKQKGYKVIGYNFPIISQLGKEQPDASGAVLGKDFKKYWRLLTKIEIALYSLK